MYMTQDAYELTRTFMYHSHLFASLQACCCAFTNDQIESVIFVGKFESLLLWWVSLALSMFPDILGNERAFNATTKRSPHSITPWMCSMISSRLESHKQLAS